jgi:hypothetical protein
LLHFLDTKLTEMCYLPCLAVVAWPFTGALVVPLAWIDAGFWWSCHTRCLRRWHSEQDVVARLSFDGCMLARHSRSEVEVEEHYI